MKTACILGATGLVGNELLSQLLANNEFEKIKVFIRKEIELNHPKLEKFLINFDDTNSWKGLVTGDVLFSAFGTTIKKAGSKDAQYKVDYTYQHEFAKAAAENGVKNYVLVSSAGANFKSIFFYSKIKGELECAVKLLPFSHISILRPSILVGERKETRIGEKVGIVLMNSLSFIPFLKKYTPIKVSSVAKGMMKAEKANKTCKIWELDEIIKLAHS